MSTEKEPQPENDEEMEEIEPQEEDIEEERPAVIKKKYRKGKIIMERTAETDEEQLLVEITEHLKRARAALVKKNYLEAVKSYQDAAIAANMAGDTERERIFLRRMNEILQNHPEIAEEEGFQLVKKRKMKTKLREEEKFSIGRVISHLIIAAIMVILVYSGLLTAIFVMDILDMASDLMLVWGISIFVEIIGITLAYLLGTRWLRWPE